MATNEEVVEMFNCITVLEESAAKQADINKMQASMLREVSERISAGMTNRL